MVQLLIQVDDRLAKELNRAVPARSRKRSEFIRQAIRKALMALEDRRTAEKYRQAPQSGPDDSATAWLEWKPAPGKRRRRR